MNMHAAALAFLGCIVGANWATGQFGLVPVGFGLVATAGTYFAGAAFVARDALQDSGGIRIVLACIAAGVVLSTLVAPSAIAVASGIAFGLSETVDLCVYTPLRKRGYLRAAVASNVAGALLDTAVFLTVAGFPVMVALPGQMVGKLAVTVMAGAVVLTVRKVRV